MKDKTEYRRVLLHVHVDMPEDGTLPALQYYIKKAIQCERGGLGPDDPMFYLDPETVSVTVKKVQSIITYGKE